MVLVILNVVKQCSIEILASYWWCDSCCTYQGTCNSDLRIFTSGHAIQNCVYLPEDMQFRSAYSYQRICNSELRRVTRVHATQNCVQLTEDMQLRTAYSYQRTCNSELRTVMQVVTVCVVHTSWIFIESSAQLVRGSHFIMLLWIQLVLILFQQMFRFN